MERLNVVFGRFWAEGNRKERDVVRYQIENRGYGPGFDWHLSARNSLFSAAAAVFVAAAVAGVVLTVLSYCWCSLSHPYFHTREGCCV